MIASAPILAPKPRELPRNIEVEQAFLGAIMADNRILVDLELTLQPELFFEPAHQRIFSAIRTVVEKGANADAVTLAHWFQDDPILEAVGGPGYLAELQGSHISIINTAEYAAIIYELARRRELIALGEELVNETFDADMETSATSLIERTESQLFSLAEQGTTRTGFQHISEAVKLATDTALAASESSDGLAGLSSGFSLLDAKLGGLHPSDLLIVAARPSMGKTVFACNIAMNAARDHGAHVAFFSLEMSAEQLAMRLLSDQANLNAEDIRKGNLGQPEFDRLFEAQSILEKSQLHFDDTPAITVGALRTRARRLMRQTGKLDLIVVDYLQLMSGGGRSDNRVQEISEISRGLKAVAKELQVPVIALSQLSRAVEQREDKKPQLSDLRESGSIEQDADVVMFLYREQYYLERSEPIRKPEESPEKFAERRAAWEQRCEEVWGKGTVIIGKQRHGPTGSLDLAFHGEFSRFTDLARDEYLPERRG